MELERSNDKLKRRLAPSGLITHVVELGHTDSTNLRLKEGDYPPGTLLYTLDQQAGRGRLGRTWSAPAGSCLAMSLSIPGEWLDDRLRPLLPLCAALAVCEGLSALCPDGDFQIKWPNDIICSGHKICGILCEHSFFDQAQRTVCGMGINLTQSAEDFARQFLPHAGSLAMFFSSVPAAEAILCAVSEALAACLTLLRQCGAPPLLRSYALRCATLGKEVKVCGAAGDFIGTAQALSDDGSLIVKTADGPRTVHAGEVSVRGLYGYLP